MAESKRLWIFGASNCLPWRLEHDDQSWMSLLAKDLDCKVENLAQEACDNLYIYHCINQVQSQIRPDDMVVVGWTHPSRKTWVQDPDNPEHESLVGDPNVLVYSGDPTFFRAYNNTVPSLSHWMNLHPGQKGKKFFDVWFKNYFSRYEQDLNLQSYIDSARTKLPSKTVFFYFSKESISGIDPEPQGLCYLDFVLQAQVAIDQNDMHANATGHNLLSKEFRKHLT